MTKILSYVTGAFALLVVTTSIIAALIYAVANGMATLSNLATSTLTGIGMAIGSCLGAAPSCDSRPPGGTSAPFCGKFTTTRPTNENHA